MKRKKMIFIYSMLVCLIFIQTPLLLSASSEKADSTTKIRILQKGVSIYQLDNGMKVLLIENPALPMVGVNVIIKIGSAYESFSTSGMSHMLEHLLFNGTTTRDQKKLYDDVDRIGGYNNAHTDNLYTDFMMVTPTENIKKGMEIQADMLFNSTLPLEKFEKEKGIVLEEISKSIADPQEQLERNILSILYAGHALSLPTLGTYSTIQSMSRDDVNSFYKNNYVPNNMMMSVIGNFQTASMLAMIKVIYGKAKPGLVIREANPEWATGLQIPKTQANSPDMIYNRFYDGDDRVMQIFFELQPGKSSEYFQLMGLILGKNKDAIQSALKTEFAESIKSLKLSVRTSPLKNYLEVVVNLSKDIDFNALLNSISAKLMKLNFKLPEETVKSEMTKACTDFVKNLEKPHMFGIYNSQEIVLNGYESVLESFYGNKFMEAAKELEGLKISSHSIIVIQSPTPKKKTESVEASNKTNLFKDESTGKSLIVVQNDVSNLLAVHYLVKHKAFYESKYGKDASRILHDCFDQRMKSDENQKISGKFGFTFTVNDNPMIPMDDIYLHPDFGYIRAEGLADNLPDAVKYLNYQLKNFIPTEAEFKKAVEKFKGITMMGMGGDKSKKMFDEEYRLLIYEPNSYAKDQIELTYDNLIAFTKEYFNPANMIVSVVSPAGAENINTFYNEFYDVQIKDEPAAFTSTFTMQKEPVKIEKNGGGERSYIFWGFISKIDPKDAPALQALSLILADDIIFDIREKQGMAYNMSAGIEVIKDKALFFVSQGTRPQNIDKLSPQYPGFFNMEAIDTLTQEELEKSINMYLGRMMFRRLSSINQAFYLGSSLYFNNDFNYDKQFLDQLKNVKLPDVKTTAQKYMVIKNPMLLIVK